MIVFWGVVRNVYSGIEPISIQEVKSSMNIAKNEKLAKIDMICTLERPQS